MTSDHSNPVALKCPQCGADLPPAPAGYLLCRYCGSSLVWHGPAISGDPTATAPTGAAVARGLRLKLIRCADPEGTGLEMFRMLVPAGWEQRGGCRWQLDNPSMPATISFEVYNPQGAEAFEILPNLNFIWNTNPMERFLAPPGSRSFGAEVLEPVTIGKAFRKFVLPRCRAAFSDLKILNEEPVPDLPQLVKSDAALTGNLAQGGKVRIAYTGQNAQLEEEIYGVVEMYLTHRPGLFGTSELVLWYIDYLFSFRAAVGRLDACADLFKVMLGSFQLNPHWYAAFKSVAQYLAQRQIQRIHHIGQIGEIMAQAGREMREQNLHDFYARQETYDRLATDHSRQIRGVDGFYDPHREEVVELPAGYGNAWANNLGEYILTDDPNFNPNLDSTLHWEPMGQK
jgi:hypothetical protein